MRLVLYAPSLSRSLLQHRLSAIAGLDLVVVGSAEEASAALETASAIVLPQNLAAGELSPHIAAAPKLRWVQLLNAGYEDMRRGMVPPAALVTTGGEGLAPAVAEHALTLLLALSRRLPACLAAQAAGHWDGDIREQMTSLYARTIIVAGLGPIGLQIARLLQTLGADVIGMSRSGEPRPGIAQVHAIGELGEQVGRADALVAVMPQNDASRGLFDAALFARCKPGMLFVNVGRGSAVVTQDLVAALHAGRLGGAGLDVTDPEPLEPGHPLWTAPNLIVSPHVAGGDGYRHLAEFIGRNVERFLAGETPAGAVSLEA